MGVYVYPTDHQWFDTLRAQAPLDEVNFWQPGGNRVFGGLKPGELFLFRLKSPINMIAGGGLFAHASVFPLITVWEAFGQKNGVASLKQLHAAISRYRQAPTGLDTQIGCIVLVAPFFLPKELWIPVPADYPLQAMQGKRYSLETQTAQVLSAWAQQFSLSPQEATLATQLRAATQGNLALITARLGQGAFRLAVSDAYSRRCAVTGEKTLPILEAAHIMPVADGGEHRIDNGLLMRRDVHRLFDLGYVTVTPEAVFRVSDALKREWQNGKEYYALDKQSISLPGQLLNLPNREALDWHNQAIFRH